MPSSKKTPSNSNDYRRRIKNIQNKLDKIVDNTSDDIIKEDHLSKEVDRIDEDLKKVIEGQREISTQTAQLCSTIEAGFSEISTRMALQSEQLADIQRAIEAPIATQARELRRRGEKAFLQGWTEDAEDDLRQAIEINYQDYLSYLLLGHIARFDKGEYAEACEWYEQAAKYAAPFSKVDQAGALIEASRVYLHKIGRYDKSFERAEESISHLETEEQGGAWKNHFSLSDFPTEHVERSGAYSGLVTLDMAHYQTAIAGWYDAHYRRKTESTVDQSRGEPVNRERMSNFFYHFSHSVSLNPWWLVSANIGDYPVKMKRTVKGLARAWSKKEIMYLKEYNKKLKWVITSTRENEIREEVYDPDICNLYQKTKELDKMSFLSLITLRERCDNILKKVCNSMIDEMKLDRKKKSEIIEEEKRKRYTIFIYPLAFVLLSVGPYLGNYLDRQDPVNAEYMYVLAFLTPILLISLVIYLPILIYKNKKISNLASSVSNLEENIEKSESVLSNISSYDTFREYVLNDKRGRFSELEYGMRIKD